MKKSNFIFLSKIKKGKAIQVKNSLLEDSGTVLDIIHGSHETGELLLITLDSFEIIAHTFDGLPKYFICEFEESQESNDEFNSYFILEFRKHQKLRQSSNSPIYDLNIERGNIELLNFCEYFSSGEVKKVFLLQNENETNVYIGKRIKEGEIQWKK